MQNNWQHGWASLKLEFVKWCWKFNKMFQYLSHDMTKPTKWLCAQRRFRSAWASAQSSLLPPWRNLGSLATHWAHSKDSDQTGQMPRLIWVFAGCTVTLLVLSCRSSFDLYLLFNIVVGNVTKFTLFSTVLFYSDSSLICCQLTFTKNKVLQLLVQLQFFYQTA